VFRILLTHMMEDPHIIGAAMDLFLVSRNLERVADLATNIAEDVVFVVEGKRSNITRKDDHPSATPLQELGIREQLDEHQPGDEATDVRPEGYPALGAAECADGPSNSCSRNQ